MRRIVIDCKGVASVAEFWQRYLDAARPQHGESFGRNLDAFEDALAGGPGWPGDCELVFKNTDDLRALKTVGGASFLKGLRSTASQSSDIRIVLS